MIVHQGSRMNINSINMRMIFEGSKTMIMDKIFNIFKRMISMVIFILMIESCFDWLFIAYKGLILIRFI
jgi:hypothetical protein